MAGGGGGAGYNSEWAVDRGATMWGGDLYTFQSALIIIIQHDIPVPGLDSVTM
jgi:hypothetical protein